VKCGTFDVVDAVNVHYIFLSSCKTIIHIFPSLNYEIEDPVTFTLHYFHTKFKM